MVVTISRILCVVFMFSVFTACRRKDSVIHTLEGSSFINSKYAGEEPLAYLINIPVLTRRDTTFTIKRQSNVRIYATGEMDTHLVEMPREYLFKSDDIELFFAKNEQLVPNPLAFSWLDGVEKDDHVEFIKHKIACRSTYDTKTQKYHWSICIPWKVLIGDAPKLNDSLKFNAAVGNNDDGIMQKAKIAWRGHSDPLKKVGADFGLIKLVNQADENIDTTKIFSQMRRVSTYPDSLEWAKLHAFDINKLVSGSIDPANNLSAQLKSCWDNVNLYFSLEVNDAKKGFAKVDIIKRSDTFHDYGWIEDDKGNVVWKMNVLYSRPAGGALKNQQIDTVINLKLGKYHLKYLTDESHNWNNWDDRAPKTNFAGIVLYHNK